MWPLVKALNDCGYPTIGCCEGHSADADNDEIPGGAFVTFEAPGEAVRPIYIRLFDMIEAEELRCSWTLERWGNGGWILEHNGQRPCDAATTKLAQRDMPRLAKLVRAMAKIAT